MMHTKTPQEDLMARYLLGELPDAEQEAVEEKLFLDDDWFDRLRVVEMELIDDYVQGRMSEKERTRFQRGFLTTPDRIEKVTNASTFIRHVDKLEPARGVEPETRSTFLRSLASYLSFQSPVMQYAKAAAALLLVVGSAWLLYDRVRLRQEVYEVRRQQLKQASELDEKIQTQRAELQQQLDLKQQELEKRLAESQDKDQQIEELKSEVAELERQQESIPNGAPGAEVITVLNAGPRPRGVREAPETVSIYLKAFTKRLTLRVQLRPPIAARYDVSLSAEAGRLVKEWPGVRPRRSGAGQYLGVTVAARLLSEGDYRLSARKGTMKGEIASENRVRIVRLRE